MLRIQRSEKSNKNEILSSTHLESIHFLNNLDQRRSHKRSEKHLDINDNENICPNVTDKSLQPQICTRKEKVCLFISSFFKTGSYYAVQAGLKLTILPQPHLCWDYKQAPYPALKSKDLEIPASRDYEAGFQVQTSVDKLDRLSQKG